MTSPQKLSRNRRLQPVSSFYRTTDLSRNCTLTPFFPVFPANVTIDGKNARVYVDGTFEALTEVGAGVQDVAVEATDKAGNVTSETWRVDNGPASGAVPTHDLEGNLLTDGHYIYTWDARNRMTSVTVGGDTWTFTYDGQNRRIAESKNSTPVRECIWHDTSVIEERLPNGIKHRFWTGGIEILDASNQQTGKRLLLHDHLGSTRVMVEGTSGTITASYDYAPWGQRAKIVGAEYWGAGYTGHWWHESGLSLAVYRPYDPRTGRWPSRDPIEEKGGVNLYAIALNSPISFLDSSGKAPVAFAVTTAITKTHRWPWVPASALGVKTHHAVVVDDNTGAILNEHKFTGTTFGIPASSRLASSITLINPCFLRVRMTGWAQNNANPFLNSIDYDLTFTVNSLISRVALHGKHDGYPSYTASALGGAYGFLEIDPSRLAPPMEIDVFERW